MCSHQTGKLLYLCEIVLIIDVQSSSTEGNNICKLEGMDCIRELPEHGTLTKQESKPGDNDCPYIYFQFVVSILSSKSNEL